MKHILLFIALTFSCFCFAVGGKQSMTVCVNGNGLGNISANFSDKLFGAIHKTQLTSSTSCIGHTYPSYKKYTFNVHVKFDQKQNLEMSSSCKSLGFSKDPQYKNPAYMYTATRVTNYPNYLWTFSIQKKPGSTTYQLSCVEQAFE